MTAGIDMMKSHDKLPLVKGALTTLTERGQVSMPAALRKQLKLKPGQPLLWEKVSNDECRIRIVRGKHSGGAKAMLGFMKQFQAAPGLPKTTSGWMRILREGER
jgi:bifunctional DNA-binding transcriptional regulator/antitoxin component of YhaV-PrlF toxin-antitoxin module